MRLDYDFAICFSYMNAELRDQSADFTREFLHVFDHKSVQVKQSSYRNFILLQSAVYDCFRSQDQDEKKAGIFIIGETILFCHVFSLPYGKPCG